MDSHTPEEVLEREHLRPEKPQQFSVAPSAKTRSMLARETVKKIGAKKKTEVKKKTEAKKMMGLDISGERGVADVVRMAKTKRIETNIVNLMSDDDDDDDDDDNDDDLGDDMFTPSIPRSTNIPSNGAENITKNSDLAEDREKLRYQPEQQQIQQQFRTKQAAVYEAMLTNEALRVKGKSVETPVLMGLVSCENEPGAEPMLRTEWGRRSELQGIRDQDGPSTKSTNSQTSSPTVLAAEVKDLRAEVSEPWVNMRAMTTAEEEAFAAEETLAEEKQNRLAEEVCGGGWVLV